MNRSSRARAARRMATLAALTALVGACSASNDGEQATNSSEAPLGFLACLHVDPSCHSQALPDDWLSHATPEYSYDEYWMRRAGCDRPMMLFRSAYVGDPRFHGIIVRKCPISAGYASWTGGPACDGEDTFPTCDACTGPAPAGFMWVAKQPPSCSQPGCWGGSCGSPSQ